MLYYLEQGPTEQAIIRAAKQQDMPLPDAIKNAPELTFGLELYYRAFLDLTTTRMQIEGPISWLAMMKWAEVNELEPEQIDALTYHISRMDSVYIAHHVKKSRAKK